MPSCPLSPTPGPIKSANNSRRECYASLSSRSFPTGATVPLLPEKFGHAPVPIRNEKSLPNVELLKNAQSRRKEALSGVRQSCRQARFLAGFWASRQNLKRGKLILASDYVSTCRVREFHFSRRPCRSESLVMYSTMLVACPASTGAFGSSRLRMHSRKLRMWLGAAELKLPGFFFSTRAFISATAGCSGYN